jgi:hypothetical protein
MIVLNDISIRTQELHVVAIWDFIVQSDHGDSIDLTLYLTCVS